MTVKHPGIHIHWQSQLAHLNIPEQIFHDWLYTVPWKQIHVLFFFFVFFFQSCHCDLCRRTYLDMPCMQTHTNQIISHFRDPPGPHIEVIIIIYTWCYIRYYLIVRDGSYTIVQRLPISCFPSGIKFKLRVLDCMSWLDNLMGNEEANNVGVPHFIMMSISGNMFHVTLPLCRESTSHRWILLTKGQKTWAFDVSLLLVWNKLLNKQSIDRWFEKSWRSFYVDVLSYAWYAVSYSDLR